MILPRLSAFRKLITKAGSDRGEGYSVPIRNHTNRRKFLLSHRNVPSLKCGSADSGLISSPPNTPSQPPPHAHTTNCGLFLRSQSAPIENFVPCSWHRLYDLSVYFYWRAIFLSSPLVFGLAK